jgi:hypothetical protein
MDSLTRFAHIFVYQSIDLKFPHLMELLVVSLHCPTPGLKGKIFSIYFTLEINKSSGQ